MVERSKDWMAQADRDLDQAKWSAQGGFYEWACFVAQQASEKAVKSLYQALHSDSWGHSVSALLRGLPEGYRPGEDTIEAAMRLDRLYIQPRYPNGFDVGSPKDYFTKSDADAALEDALRVLTYCKSKLP